MSLKLALNNSNLIDIKNGILTISEMSTNMKFSVLYSCFIVDIQLNHPQLGKGKVLDFENDKWICDFEYSTALQEMKSKTLINYIN